MNSNKRSIWQSPWGYREGFLIAFALIFIGFALTYISNGPVATVKWPMNLYMGIFMLASMFVFYFVFRKRAVFKWLTNSKVAISVIAAYTFLVLFMGFIPQNMPEASGFIKKIGLANIVSSHAFFLIQIYFLFILGLITIKKIFQWKRSQIPFIINHLGLWIALFAATLGAGDLQRIKVTINENVPVFSGTNQSGKVISDLGVAIQLKKFDIEEFSPKAYIIDGKSGKTLSDKLFYCEKDAKDIILDWEIEVSKVYKYAVVAGETFHPVHDIGTAPASYMVCRNVKTNATIEGWISCGSFRYPGDYLTLPDSTLLVMADPEPKRYSSLVKIFTPEGKAVEGTVEVNKPLKANGWNIYQLSYDEKKGRWSEISVLELVRDPWHYAVYVGFYMMIFGALFMFWIGNKKKIY